MKRIIMAGALAAAIFLLTAVGAGATSLPAGPAIYPGKGASVRPEAAAPARNLYLYVGSGSTAQAMLYPAAENGEGTEPASIEVPGAGPTLIEDKYGTKSSVAGYCAPLDYPYPGWKSTSSFAGLECAVLQNSTSVAQIGDVSVIAWLADAQAAGSFVSQCLQYTTFTLKAPNEWTTAFVSLYWDSNPKVDAWETFNNNIYGAQSDFCSAPVTLYPVPPPAS